MFVCLFVVFPGGGFHHCSASSGGGFCAYADISLAIKVLTVLEVFELAKMGAI